MAFTSLCAKPSSTERCSKRGDGLGLTSGADELVLYAVIGGNDVGGTAEVSEFVADDSPHADTNNMMVIINITIKGTNLSWSLIKELLRIALPPSPWLG
jgi:hypothetical protein